MVALLVAAACSDSPEATEAASTGVAAPEPTASEAPRPRDPKTPGWREAACSLPRDYVLRIMRGHFPGRSPDITIVPGEPHFVGEWDATTHSGPWDYLQRVPIILYGPGYIQDAGSITPEREVTVADIAPTLSELLDSPWPTNRPGNVLEEALVPAEDRTTPPKLIVTVVWDGGGWNVLEKWSKKWPFLKSVIERGTSFANGTVGSSPSVTPAVHATIGTGAFPNKHGIVSIRQRDGTEVVETWGDSTPTYLRRDSLASIFDARMRGQSKVVMFAEKNWHLGMIGHGAYIAGGDHDIGAMIGLKGEDMFTNEQWYSLPDYINEIEGFDEAVQQVDLTDGKLDNHWRGLDILDVPMMLLRTPVWVLHQTTILKELIAREGLGADTVPDLLFTNYKGIDHAGHRWNMVNGEVPELIKYSDNALKELVGYIDDRVGADNWVLAVTADHGQTPLPRSIGAWPIDIFDLENDIARRFGLTTEELFQEEKPNGMWLDPATIEAAGLSLKEVSDFILDYRIRDNAPKGDLPSGYRDRGNERLFDAAFPSNALPKIWECVN